ncbi:MAG: hypothetical protein IT350_01240 [Deltaproteobacteria bacterium]|nr:hypothetical protein [Deltaproteobacteria bacterium]
MVEKSLRCPRCGTVTPVSTGQCVKCGLKMVKKKKSGEVEPESAPSPARVAPPAGPTATKALPGAAPPASPAKPQRPPESPPRAVSAKSGVAMPKLRVDGLERHDDDAKKATSAGEGGKRLKGLEQTAVQEKRGAAPPAKDEFKSLLMEPHEVDGPGVDRVSPPNSAEDDTSIQNLMLAPHETFGDTTAVDPVAAKGKGIADSFGFKPLYKIQEDPGPRPPGESAGYDTTGLANALPPAGGISHRMSAMEGAYQDPYAVDSLSDAPMNPDAARFRRSGPKTDDGPPADEVVYQLKVRQAKNRIFTRILPMALFAAAFWFGGREFLLPMLLIQGEWKGRIVDIDDRHVGMDMHLSRTGRKLAGTVKFEFPKTPEGLMHPGNTPRVFGQVIHGADGKVVGEFDVNKIYLKVWSGDADSYLLLEGGHTFDTDGQMIVRDGKATNSEDSSGTFVLVRVTTK